jgi:hypothetical protein
MVTIEGDGAEVHRHGRGGLAFDAFKGTRRGARGGEQFIRA